MVTPAVYKAYTTSTFYLHLLLPRQHQRTERKKKEVENERRENILCVLQSNMAHA